MRGEKPELEGTICRGRQRKAGAGEMARDGGVEGVAAFGGSDAFEGEKGVTQTLGEACRGGEDAGEGIEILVGFRFGAWEREIGNEQVVLKRGQEPGEAAVPDGLQNGWLGELA